MKLKVSEVKRHSIMKYIIEEGLRDDTENGKLSVPFPNPSETPSLKMIEKWNMSYHNGKCREEGAPTICSFPQAS